MARWKQTPLHSCTIDLTENCNLRCTYCFTWGKTQRVLPEKLGKKIIDFFYDHFDNQGYAEISFWGGEPLLEFDLLKRLVKYAEKKLKGKVIFGGTTNGTLLDEDKLKFLTDHNCKMLLSLDGNREHHNKFRVYPNGQGSYDDIMEKLPVILKYWPDLRLRFSLTPELIPILPNVIENLYKEGVKYFIFSPVYELEWKDNDFKLLEKKLKLILKFLKEHQDVTVQQIQDPISSPSQEYPCGAGRSYVGFGVDGTIAPCHRFRKYGPNHTAWNQKIYIGHVDHGFYPLREIFIDFPIIRKEQCNECEAYYFCGGGCYAINYELSGNIFGFVPYLCKYEKTIGKVVKHERKQTINTKLPQNRSCICYNACYLENTPNEIRHIDPSANFACMCFNTNYQGKLNDQFRPLVNR